jgi:group I intron endonuclease
VIVDSGIYWFRNKVNGKIYIGQSKYLNTRYREHKCELLKGIHHNTYLQKSVDKYGFENFEYRILKRCPVDELDYWEEFYIKKYETLNREKGYNIKQAGNESEMPEEVKKKIQQANLGKNGKLTAEQVERIKLDFLNGIDGHILADEYGVDFTTINKITRCVNWKQVRPDLENQLLSYYDRKEKETACKVKELYSIGYSVNKIEEVLQVGNKTVKRILKSELEDKAQKEQQIREDFLSGVSRAEIVQKYNLSDSVYKRIVRDLREVKREKEIEQILDLLSKGVQKKDIAKILGYNRCTINEILKKYNEAHANTEIISQIAKG